MDRLDSHHPAVGIDRRRATERPGATGTRSRLRVRVESLRYDCFGKVFNDLHHEAVGYHLVPHAPYHSYIETEHLRVETDREGHPVYVSVSLRGAKTGKSIISVPPPNFDVCSLRFLDLRTRFLPPQIQFDRDKALMYIQFSESTAVRHVAFEPHAIWAVDASEMLTGLWLCRIVMDPTSKRFSRWRRRAWSRVHRDQLRDPASAGGLRIPTSMPENANRA